MNSTEPPSASGREQRITEGPGADKVGHAEHDGDEHEHDDRHDNQPGLGDEQIVADVLFTADFEDAMELHAAMNPPL